MPSHTHHEKTRSSLTTMAAEGDVGMSTVLEDEFAAWSEKSGNDKIFLLENTALEDGRVQLKLLLDLYEVKLYVPIGYPNYELGCNFHCEAPAAICIWCNALNEFLLDENQGQLQLANVLERVSSTYTTKPKRNCSATSVSSEEDISEDEMEGLEGDVYADDPPSDDDKIFTTEWELRVARLKTRWRLKELELRQSLSQSETTDVQRLNISNTGQIEQIFSFPAASGILSNDLIDIMQYEKESGIAAIPVDDNIFKWIVKLSKFEMNAYLHQDLEELKKLHAIDYVELHMDFAMDLYPFYPPLVKIVRPRLKGFNNENLTSFDFLKLFQLSYWNPACSMRNILEKLKHFLQGSFRVNLLNRKNDPLLSPEGPYFDVEHALLRLSIVGEISPNRSQENPAYPDVHLQKYTSTFNSTPEVPKCHSPYLPLYFSKIPKKAKILLKEASNKANPLQKQYWAKGTGYGHPSRPGWDVTAFMAAQKEKDRQVELVLCDILTELQKEFAKMKYEILVDPLQIPEVSAVEVVSSADLPNDNSNFACDWSSSGNGSSSTVGSFSDAVLNDNETEDLLDVLKSSSLVPFLEKHLRVDTFLEISRHSGLYKVIVALLKEIALQKNFATLFILLPGQDVSLFRLLKTLGSMALFIQNRMDKVAANGCIPGMSHNSETESAAENIDGSNPCSIADEKLAREFSELLDIVTESLRITGHLSSESSIEDYLDEATDDDNEDVVMECGALSPCLPSTSSDKCEDEILSQIYCKCLKQLQFESWNMELQGANIHYFARVFTAQGPGNQPQVLRIAQELASLSTSLPLDLGSSIFVRTDEEKCTLMRALITGPEGTPYSNGCFTFDIHFPNTFPKHPPQVHFKTTGGGTVRFNPNLYASGRVCLSLLGTWAGIQGEQWSELSTILQVLVSIQSLILIAEPYFNEPGYETMIGTNAGKKTSLKYNNEIKANCIKYAMIGQLQNPSAGFEEVIRAHFYIKRRKIINDVEKWVGHDCAKGEFAAHVTELKTLLLNLEPPNEDVAKLAG